MTKFKKCVMDYCSNVATKEVRVEIPCHEQKWGGWRDSQLKGNEFKINKRMKWSRFKLCKVCYDCVVAEDFYFRDGCGGYMQATRIEKV